MKENFIRALSIDGSTIIDFVYNEKTHLYHYDGDVRYAGYTKEELEPRRVS